MKRSAIQLIKKEFFPHHEVFLIFDFFKFMAKCNKSFDPFALPEKILCEVFFTMGRDLPPKAATKETKKSK